ncbi:MAG: hypothetical protein NT141_00875 [candidate division WWE3 bacterium]|nr:hypothetical protein [candidate division WWE3 bacterium]
MLQILGSLLAWLRKGYRGVIVWKPLRWILLLFLIMPVGKQFYYLLAVITGDVAWTTREFILPAPILSQIFTLHADWSIAWFWWPVCFAWLCLLPLWISFNKPNSGLFAFGYIQIWLLGFYKWF